MLVRLVSIKKLSILGSTGSIGRQALDVCRLQGYTVLALTAYNNTPLLEEQVREFRPKMVVVCEKDAYNTLKTRLADTDIRVLFGMEGICEAAAIPQTDIVLNAIVGIAGLLPTLAAINAQKPVALANKETLVTGGALVTELARQKGVSILPVDSEHSAIFQCLQGNNNQNQVQRILLTASGGPFFGSTREQLEDVTVEQALRHPNWSMGAKITIDSATMMNKGLEIIEAAWLFGIMPEAIEVLIHRESVIHSAVEFADGAVIAQLGVPDMRVPIQYALTYPERLATSTKRLSLTDYGKLTFFQPDYDTFSCLTTAKRAFEMGGFSPCIANGANEQAVALFLGGKIRFTQIGELVAEAVEAITLQDTLTVENILQADQSAREFVLKRCALR